MQVAELDKVADRLRQLKSELTERLVRINENHRRPLEVDSKERATQLENSEVVDALGNEAREELDQIAAAFCRIDAGEFGVCPDCGDTIGENRLLAFPQAEKCIECASRDEEIKRITG